MVTDSQPWIRVIQEPGEHGYHDPFYPDIKNRNQSDNRQLEDRVSLLEEIIKVLRKEIKDLNKQLKQYRGVDISALSNADFWLTEEDDVWDTV